MFDVSKTIALINSKNFLNTANFPKFINFVQNLIHTESRICSHSSFPPDLTVVRPSRSTTQTKKNALLPATFNDPHRAAMTSSELCDSSLNNKNLTKKIEFSVVFNIFAEFLACKFVKNTTIRSNFTKNTTFCKL
uniref:Uncharacterized protein n=1 Tax=Romanomermis culicivorax TaxID=13658 RepID=A0A915IX87_ROMCU